jgi:hypothetical protein
MMVACDETDGLKSAIPRRARGLESHFLFRQPLPLLPFQISYPPNVGNPTNGMPFALMVMYPRRMGN